MDGTIARRLPSELGSFLAAPAVARGQLPAFRARGLEFVQIAGVAPTENGRYAVEGCWDAAHPGETAGARRPLRAQHPRYPDARACGGDLDRVRRVMMVRGFVNAAEDFEDVPLVINGVDQDSHAIEFSDRRSGGTRLRTSIGCATLPSRVAVEIDALKTIDDSGL